MTIHKISPFAIDKNLGRAYNRAFEICPDGDWLCVTDYDVLILSPNSIPLMYDYIAKYTETGIFVCRTNRIGSPHQIARGLHSSSSNDSVKFWEGQAKRMESKWLQVTEINDIVSGFLMLISKETWNEIKFSEDMRCLGVDNDFSQRVLESGRKILCMESILVWHTYRLSRGVNDKKHLL